MYHSLFIHSSVSGHSFLWLSSIPLYICTTASLSIHLSVDIPFYDWVVFHCIYVPQPLYPFICHGHSFRVLAIINSAVVTIGVHVSFSVLISSGYMPRSGIAGSYDGFIPSFLLTLWWAIKWIWMTHHFPPFTSDFTLRELQCSFICIIIVKFGEWWIN